MNAKNWFYAQSFNCRVDAPAENLRVKICGFDSSTRTVHTEVEGKPIDLAFGPLDRIPAGEEIIRRARQAYQGQVK
jgi:hypothetical protein